MTRPVRIGVQVKPEHATYAEIRRTVAALEELGVDIAFNWDHFFPVQGEEGRHYECWTMLGAWAEATERIEIGALVTGGGYRNPDLLADMARTVDHISDGRLILGVGAGWNVKDYDEYGYEIGTPKTRLDLFEASLARIDARLAKLDPPPVRPLPILVGGGGERRTMRLAARHATIWHGFGDVETMAHKVEVLERWCAEEGRDPAAIERSASVRDATPEELGDPLVDLGFTLLTLAAPSADPDLGRVREWLAWRDERNAAVAA